MLCSWRMHDELLPDASEFTHLSIAPWKLGPIMTLCLFVFATSMLSVQHLLSPFFCANEIGAVSCTSAWTIMKSARTLRGRCGKCQVAWPVQSALQMWSQRGAIPSQCEVSVAIANSAFPSCSVPLWPPPVMALCTFGPVHTTYSYDERFS